MSLIYIHNAMARKIRIFKIKVFNSVHSKVADKIGEGRESVQPSRKPLPLVLKTRQHAIYLTLLETASGIFYCCWKTPVLKAGSYEKQINRFLGFSQINKQTE